MDYDVDNGLPEPDSISYHAALERLNHFSTENLEHVNDMSKLAIVSSAVGQDLSIIIRRGGHQVKDAVQYIHSSDDESEVESNTYWRYRIKASTVDGLVQADFVEHNGVGEIAIETPTIHLMVPVDAEEYRFTSDNPLNPMVSTKGPDGSVVMYAPHNKNMEDSEPFKDLDTPIGVKTYLNTLQVCVGKLLAFVPPTIVDSTSSN